MLTKKEQRLRRARQTRIRIATQGVARLTVNRTNLHIYATVIAGTGDRIVATASSVQADVRSALGGSGKGGNTGQELDGGAIIFANFEAILEGFFGLGPLLFAVKLKGDSKSVP